METLEDEIEYNEIQLELQKLLDEIDVIVLQEYEELLEIETKMLLSSAIVDGFILQKDGYTLPTSFGLKSKDADKAIGEALKKYIDRMNPLVEKYNLDSDEKRMEAFQDLDVDNVYDNDVEDFFDWIEDLDDFI
jgi:TPP-dependent indolepyruvate ferredoxin oxidoreductase alpha subunit